MIVLGDEKFSAYFKNSYVINKNKRLPSAVNSHVDMNFCVIDDTVFLPRENDLANLFSKFGYKVKLIRETLKNKYPHDVSLNCKAIGKTVILNCKTVSKDILEYCENSGKKIINVPQGYAACSTLAISETAFITSDKGVYNALAKAELNPLLIKEGYIEIEEYDYGFIGGASGFCDGTLFFFGDITAHPDYKRIEQYLAENNVKYRYFDVPLRDIGGIFDLKKIKKDV